MPAPVIDYTTLPQTSDHGYATALACAKRGARKTRRPFVIYLRYRHDTMFIGTNDHSLITDDRLWFVGPESTTTPHDARLIATVFCADNMGDTVTVIEHVERCRH